MNEGARRSSRWARWLVVGVVGFTQACVSTSGPGDGADSPFPLIGQILRVNPVDGYVVAESITLPSPGDFATVWRDGAVVGRVQFSESARGAYVVADIVSGLPRRGDWLRRDTGAGTIPQGE